MYCSIHGGKPSHYLKVNNIFFTLPPFVLRQLTLCWYFCVFLYILCTYLIFPPRPYRHQKWYKWKSRTLTHSSQMFTPLALFYMSCWLELCRIQISTIKIRYVAVNLLVTWLIFGLQQRKLNWRGNNLARCWIYVFEDRSVTFILCIFFIFWGNSLNAGVLNALVTPACQFHEAELISPLNHTTFCGF